MSGEKPVLLHVETLIHGRVLISPSNLRNPRGLLVGFHGYAENAKTQLDRLIHIAASEWLLCSVQALHPFYTRSDGEVVANWMTRLDRDLAIEENLEYVGSVLRRIGSEYPPSPQLAFCGFSQGAAMAYRAAVAQPAGTAAMVAVGGDIPPELNRTALGGIKSALVARGLRDRHYPAEKMDEDLERLAEAGVPTCAFTFEGAHQWLNDLSARIRAFLEP